MRKFDVAYNPPLPDSGEMKKKIEDMDVDELQKQINQSCMKCRGDFTVCESCKGCLEGRMIIDKLREPEKKQRDTSGMLKMGKLSPVQKQEVAKKLYHDALMSDDPVKFIMEQCGIDEGKAKGRLYQYKRKYHYVRDKVEVEKAFPDKVKLEPKKMIDLVPKKEQTVDELVRKLEKERNDLVKEIEKLDIRLGEIEQTLKVIRSVAG